MKLIRLQSGPLACVYRDEEEELAPPSRDSGTYRAFSGSVEAKGASENDAIDALDRNLRRLSAPPRGEVEGSEPVSSVAITTDRRDTDHCESLPDSRPQLADAEVRDTVRSPCPSSLPAIAFEP